eukprot:scaffold500304_cov18-Prasinocladus_malaysianus.AAC.2
MEFGAMGDWCGCVFLLVPYLTNHRPPACYRLLHQSLAAYITVRKQQHGLSVFRFSSERAGEE